MYFRNVLYYTIVVPCQPGQYSTEGDGYEPCNLCPDGSWQNETGQSFCYECDYGKPTGREGATSSSECGEHFIVTPISIAYLYTSLDYYWADIYYHVEFHACFCMLLYKYNTCNKIYTLCV